MSTDIVIDLRACVKFRIRAGLIALSLLALAVFGGLTPWQVSGQEQPAHAFSGTVLVDGAAPENGTKLTAWLGNQRIGEVRVRRGKFRIVIPQHQGVSFAGRKVTFRLGDRKFQWTGVWKAGGTTELVLTTGGKEPLSPSVTQFGSDSPSALLDQGFVGAEPLTCDRFRVDAALDGMIRDQNKSISSRIKASLKQTGCRLAGELRIVSPLLNGSGPLRGTVDGNFVRFTVAGATNDAGEDVNFSGIIEGNRIEGQYFLPRSKGIGEWIVVKENASPGALAEWVRQVESQPTTALTDSGPQLDKQAGAGDRADPVAGSPAVRPTAANAPTAPEEEQQNGQQKDQPKRGFFFNSISGGPNSLNLAMDPTTLAVIGILITLAGTAVQLVRGN